MVTLSYCGDDDGGVGQKDSPSWWVSDGPWLSCSDMLGLVVEKDAWGPRGKANRAARRRVRKACPMLQPQRGCNNIQQSKMVAGLLLQQEVVYRMILPRENGRTTAGPVLFKVKAIRCTKGSGDSGRCAPIDVFQHLVKFDMKHL
jgi:hypothetical protein